MEEIKDYLDREILNGLRRYQTKYDMIAIWEENRRKKRRSLYMKYMGVGIAASLLATVWFIQPFEKHSYSLMELDQLEQDVRATMGSHEIIERLKENDRNGAQRLIDSLRIEYQSSLFLNIPLDSLTEEQREEKEVAEYSLKDIDKIEEIIHR